LVLFRNVHAIEQESDLLPCTPLITVPFTASDGSG